MISFEDRMALVRAGYTAIQIAEFDSQQPEQSQPEQPQPEQSQPEQSQPEQPQPEQSQPEQPQPDFASMMQSINNSMAAMLAAMQAQNIKSADMGNPQKETPSDILAKLLNP